MNAGHSCREQSEYVHGFVFVSEGANNSDVFRAIYIAALS